MKEKKISEIIKNGNSTIIEHIKYKIEMKNK